MEAINLGGIDFVTTGDAPPIIAQAVATPFVYIGIAAAPKGEAMVIPRWLAPRPQLATERRPCSGPRFADVIRSTKELAPNDRACRLFSAHRRCHPSSAA